MRQDPSRSGGGQAAHWVSGAASFVYLGQGRLTVTGPLTGTIYRFTGNGEPVQVNGSDVASLVSVPGLRLVR